MMWRSCPKSFATTKKNLVSTESFSTTKKDCFVAVWGFGDRGQLGLGESVQLQLSPKKLDNFPCEEIGQFKVGYNHSLICAKFDEKQTLLGFGVAEEGQLYKKGVILPSATPISHPLFQNKSISKIAVGGAHSIIETTDEDKFGNSQLIGFGRNTHGQLGLGSYTDTTEPTELTFFRGISISSISCGEDFSVISTSNKQTYFLGRTDGGQMGRKEAKQSPVPTLLSELNGVAISQLCSGWGHTLAISEGNVFSWGSNMHSQCGHNIKSQLYPISQIPLQTKIEKVSCGGCHSMLLGDNKTVFIFGSGGDGKMMSPTNSDLLVPTIVQWFVENKIQVSDIASGIDHLCVVDTNSNIWSWGFGQHGTFGAGKESLKTSIVPVVLRNPFPGFKLKRVECGMDVVMGLWQNY